MDKQLYNLGYHITYPTILTDLNTVHKDHRVFQIYLGKPQGFCKPEVFNIIKAKQMRPDIEIVVHAPFWLNPSSVENRKRDLQYIANTVALLNRAGVTRYVVHTGATEDPDFTKNIALFCKQYLKVTQGTDVKLCLENDAGSKKGTKRGDPILLNNIVKYINDPRVRMTFDTEHSYARGDDIESDTFLDNIQDSIEVLHLNSIPIEVDKGSFLDRHSYVTLGECKEGIDFMIRLFNRFKDRNIPMIMEIKEPNIAHESTRQLKEKLGIE